MNKQFEKLCKDNGLTIQPVGIFINGHWCKRPDVLSVRYAGHYIMSIPAKMYDHPTEKYRTLEGTPHQMYYDREYHLLSWIGRIKRGNFIEQKDKQMREIIRLEKTL